MSSETTLFCCGKATAFGQTQSCWLLELVLDESLLTGESVPVGKAEGSDHESQHRDNRHIVYSGTLVVSGHGTGSVFATGVSTELGKIGTALSTVWWVIGVA